MCQSEREVRLCPPSSPVRNVDPLVRALHTLMYGLVVHFGTLWMIESNTTNNKNSTDDIILTTEDGSSFPGFIVWILFLHEYWVYLQHSNVFANPFCQHLDRQYGIALLRSNEHWAIAGTLSAYWCRETLGMFFCLPFLQNNSHHLIYYRGFSITQYLILYSLIYHTVKSRGIREDTLRRYSPKFGITRLVIDKFYIHSTSEIYLTALRIFLQGLDTWIHFCIVRDLVLFSYGTSSFRWFVLSMHALFSIWVIHAALNQLFRCR